MTLCTGDYLVESLGMETEPNEVHVRTREAVYRLATNWLHEEMWCSPPVFDYILVTWQPYKIKNYPSTVYSLPIARR